MADAVEMFNGLDVDILRVIGYRPVSEGSIIVQLLARLFVDYCEWSSTIGKHDEDSRCVHAFSWGRCGAYMEALRLIADTPHYPTFGMDDHSLVAFDGEKYKFATVDDGNGHVYKRDVWYKQFT